VRPGPRAARALFPTPFCPVPRMEFCWSHVGHCPGRLSPVLRSRVPADIAPRDWTSLRSQFCLPDESPGWVLLWPRRAVAAANPGPGQSISLGPGTSGATTPDNPGIWFAQGGSIALATRANRSRQFGSCNSGLTIRCERNAGATSDLGQRPLLASSESQRCPGRLSGAPRSCAKTSAGRRINQPAVWLLFLRAGPALTRAIERLARCLKDQDKRR